MSSTELLPCMTFIHYADKFQLKPFLQKQQAICLLILLMVMFPHLAQAVNILPLSAYFPQSTTLVTNSKGDSLPKALNQIPKNENGTPDYSIGVAFLNKKSGLYQTGMAYAANAIVILPPDDANDFIRLDLLKPSQTNLTASKTWYLNGTYGIAHDTKNNSLGVKVEVMVFGDPIDMGEARSAVIDSFSVSQTKVASRSTPLGAWPLRRNFHLGLRVSIAGSSNEDSNLVVAGAVLEATVARPELGIVQSNLVWDKNAAKWVNGIGALGSRWLRTDIRGSNQADDFANIAMQANQQNMRVLAVIQADEEDFTDPAAATAYAGQAFNKLCGYPGGSLRLSMTNLSLYRARLENYLQQIKNKQARVDAFEIGNEYDWVCFNGDVPFQKTASAADMTVFLKKYALILEISHQLIKQYFPNSKVLSFSTANCYSWIQTSCVRDPIRLLQKLAFVNGKNYLTYADGYALHLYPVVASPWEARVSLVNYANALGINKDFWVTEWGFNRAAVADRYPAFRSFLEYMNSTWNIPLGGLFLYNYVDDGGFSLINAAGTLDPAARVIKQYNQRLPAK